MAGRLSSRAGLRTNQTPADDTLGDFPDFLRMKMSPVKDETQIVQFTVTSGKMQKLNVLSDEAFGHVHLERWIALSTIEFCMKLTLGKF